MVLLKPQNSFPKELWIEYANNLEKEIKDLEKYIKDLEGEV